MKWESVFYRGRTCWFCPAIVAGHRFSSVWEQVCRRCQGRMKRITPPSCWRCGRAMGHGEICGECKRRSKNRTFVRNRSVTQYQGWAKHIIRMYKFQGKREWATPLGEMMAELLWEHQKLIDLITYVPLSPARWEMRGYNQAELLAQVIARRLRVPMVSTLRRLHSEQVQSSRSRYARLQGSGHLYSLYSGRVQDKLKQKRIVIVDDVYTTGATLHACAQTIAACDPKKMESVTFAR
ncbi:ComF family protein [Mechercharimyces sp. CAU 1602]|uniref:ComF family protein n=1 Tax=Mechercharimyces sp. CAU 1602 TaxID=2973933 RepID=UPI0021618C74|nr:ComF family protein [Mechercharimyces sp. CAU 1602]